MKKKILVVTPVHHIEGFLERLKKNFVTINLNNPTEKQLLKKIKNVDFIFTNPNMSKIYFSEKNLSLAKNLKCICTASTGTNHIDKKYIKKNKIKLISLRSKKSIISKISSTAEHAFALMLCSLRLICQSSSSVKKNKWNYLPFIGRQLNFLTVGVIGYGRLGKMFVNFLKPFTKNILIYESNFNLSDSNKKYQTSLKNLLIKSDIISLHIHADDRNKNFLNQNKFKYMKKNVLIINTSRGEIINEFHLKSFLNKNKNSKYATDVLRNEIRKRSNNKILKEFKKNNKQIIITPHIGGMTEDAQRIAYNSALDELIKSNNNNEF